MIGIIDYGMGNLLSVYSAFDMLGAEVEILGDASDLKSATKLVLPGVGAFRDCIANLRQKGFVDALQEEVFLRRKPILGICLGMEAMARRSFEGGEYDGLGWFDADVVRLQPDDPGLTVPHVGWNNLEYRTDFPLFSGLPPAPDFYFVHSYAMKFEDDSPVVATCDYGGKVTAAVWRDSIFATQFHPEKSQDYGLRLLQNFLNWNP